MTGDTKEGGDTETSGCDRNGVYPLAQPVTEREKAFFQRLGESERAEISLCGARTLRLSISVS